MAASLVGQLALAVKGDLDRFRADLRTQAPRIGDEVGTTLGARIKARLSAANIGTAVGATLGGLGVGALRLADDYKAAVDAIRVGTGATGEALGDLEASFGRVAGRVREDIGSTATVMAAFNTGLGLTGDDLEGLTERAIKFARITKFDLVNGTSDIIRLFGDWSVASEDQEQALDKVFRASQTTGIGVDELMRLMVQFGAPLRQLGYDFDSAAALMGKWEREGVNTELVIGGMRIALGKLAKEGVPAEDMADAFRDRLEAIATSANPATDAIALFGQRAGADLAAAIHEGRFAIDDYVGLIADGSDTFEAAIADSRTFADTFGEIKNAVAVAAGPIVKDLAGIGSELGNLVFLLPALGGGLGRGLGALWTRAGGGAAVRAAAKAAGAVAGAVYH